MSKERQDTIEDIVADIRAQNQGLPEDSYALSPLVCDLLSFADRIEAEHKREMADENRISDAVIQSLRDKKLEMAGEIAAKENEIASLRAALKPVLELEENNSGLWPFAALAVAAVKEAQRIYKEVTK